MKLPKFPSREIETIHYGESGYSDIPTPLQGSLQQIEISAAAMQAASNIEVRTSDIKNLLDFAAQCASHSNGLSIDDWRSVSAGTPQEFLAKYGNGVVADNQKYVQELKNASKVGIISAVEGKIEPGAQPVVNPTTARKSFWNGR